MCRKIGSWRVMVEATSPVPPRALDQMNGVIHQRAVRSRGPERGRRSSAGSGLYRRRSRSRRDESSRHRHACAPRQTQGTSSDLEPATNFASQGAAGGPSSRRHHVHAHVSGSTQLGWRLCADAWSVADVSRLAPERLVSARLIAIRRPAFALRPESVAGRCLGVRSAGAHAGVNRTSSGLARRLDGIPRARTRGSCT
jgi:hypothetical protein